MLVPGVWTGSIMAVVVDSAGVEVQIGNQVCEVDDTLASGVL